MSRLSFTKEGQAIYVSHLDLMRIMRRALLRAGIPVAHSEGFNPHANINVALPLPLGHSSVCELMDFTPLEDLEPEEAVSRLNGALPEGIRALRVYEGGRPFREIEYLKHSLELIYDGGVPENAEQELEEVFSRDSLIVFRKTKKTQGDFDIAPCVKSAALRRSCDSSLACTAVLTAARPMLNPVYLTKAIDKYAPGLAPDFVRYRRTDILDAQGLHFE